MKCEEMNTKRHYKKLIISMLFLFVTLILLTVILPTSSYAANNLSNSYFNVTIGSYGEIYSLKLAGDSYSTNFVMNTSNAPNQNTAGHQWMGELMFKYKLGSASTYSTAYTQSSSDVRVINQNGNTVTVSYANSSNSNGIRNFSVVETYSLANDYFLWSTKVTNTSSQTLTIGDWGYPLPFNEFWTGGDAIYETRAVDHSFTGKNASYIYATRPSGLGSYVLMVPDYTTGAGFEYQDHWRTQEHSATNERAWCQDQSGWQNGLNVFYIHSDSIKSTNRGYLPNTSLTLAPGASKTYTFKFFKVANDADLKNRLYNEGLIDFTVVPGMIVSTDMTAKFDLHTSKTINSITAQYPSETTITSLGTTGTNHKLYSIKMSHLGQNNITINYGSGETTTMQFYAIEPIGTALQRHATFMVNSTQWGNTGDIRAYVFDDWMMNTRAKRNSFAGYWGWGDDWGLTHGQFLAEKNVLTPVASEVEALDNYLTTAIWTNLMNGHHSDYLIHDFLMYGTNDTPTYRGYAYPHIYNTYFSMYKIARMYPNLISYDNSATTYLLRCYNIFKALYGPGVAYNWNTGLMGELTTPEIIQALRDEGYNTEANTLQGYMTTKYNNFKNTTYPYGSEYSYDNTGEEAVYTLAKMNNNTTMMNKIDLKTRACRGNQPIWYFYANPVTNCGENWWQFQYTMALAGYCMDDYLRYQSNDREVAQRMSYAAKMGLICTINSGQMSSVSANIGTVAWTYQAEKGNLGAQGVGNGTLHNGWRDMAGEADLGLFGAIKILSSDVAVDPIFGLYGYGCDVTQSGNNYVITPRDGVFKRLNLITEKLYVELNRDKYTSATVAKAKNYVELALANQYTQASHTTKLSIYGLAAGSYNVLVNNVQQSSFNATANSKSTINLNIGTAATYNIKITQGQATNSAPIVDAGSNRTFAMPTVTLSGTASDDGLPNGTLTTTWSLVSGPGTVSISNASSLNTTATVSTTGTYVFRLTASDGALSSNDTVTMTVNQTSTKINIAPIGTASTSFCSSWESIDAINDGHDPAHSNDRTYTVYGNWDNPGTTQWIQYDFSQNYKIDSMDVYWFDDDQGIDLPASCSVQYWNGSSWVNVSNASGLGVLGNQYNNTTFTTVTTNRIRLNITAKSSYSTGVLEWKVYGEEAGGGTTESNLALNATSSTSFCSSWESITALNDGHDPAHSNDRTYTVYGNWDNPGTTQWVQYDWTSSKTISSIKVYWFDDDQGIDLPASCSIQYWNGSAWVNVSNPVGLGVLANQYNTTTFTPVSTTRIRLNITAKSSYSTGILEWQVWGY